MKMMKEREEGGKRPYTPEEVKACIEECRMAVPAEFVIAYWDAKRWLTKKGTTVKSLQVAASVCNSIYLERVKKGVTGEALTRVAMPEKRLFRKLPPYEKQLETKEWAAFVRFILTVKGCA